MLSGAKEVEGSTSGTYPAARQQWVAKHKSFVYDTPWAGMPSKEEGTGSEHRA